MYVMYRQRGLVRWMKMEEGARMCVFAIPFARVHETTRDGAGYDAARCTLLNQHGHRTLHTNHLLQAKKMAAESMCPCMRADMH